MNITNPIFHDEAKAIAHIEAQRWNGEPSCRHCGSFAVRKMGGKTQAGMFLCNDCRDKFTVRTGTVMERSHIPLHKWLLATHIMAASKKGVSASQMARMIGVTYKSAWFLCHRIREAMEGAAPTGPMGGKPDAVVEADETYVGGKAKNRATREPAPKKAVLALVERDGVARSFHIANVNAKNVRGVLVTNVERTRHALAHDRVTVMPGEGDEQRVVILNLGNFAKGEPPEADWKTVGELQRAYADLKPVSMDIMEAVAPVVSRLIEQGVAAQSRPSFHLDEQHQTPGRQHPQYQKDSDTGPE